MFKKLIDILKAHPRKIVFTEGTDPRILEASARLLSGTFLTPVLVGNEEAVRAAAEDAGFNIRGAIIVDPENYENMEAMVAKMVELRKGKMTEDECRTALKKGNYFGTMLVAMGEADALLGGATYSTADTVRPALQLVKTKPGNKIVSSCFILVRPSATGDNDVLAMGDCAINIKPSEDELVEIAMKTAKCAQIFGIDPKVAFLSYSTSAPARARTWTRCATPARRPGLLCLSSPWMVRCSSTPLFPPVWRRPSALTPRWPAMPTPSSSPTSTLATSATRLPSAWAASRPMAPSCWA